MKNSLYLLLLPFLFFAQRKEVIKLNYPVKDFTRTTKSLEVIDLRKVKVIKDIVYRGNYYSFSFPTDNLSQDIQNWFLKSNKANNKATNDIVMLVEDLNIFNEVRHHEILCVLAMKFSTFLKKNNHYYFLKRYDNVIGLSTKEVDGIPNNFVENTQKVLQKIMFDSYRATPSETAISMDDLYNYNAILKVKLPVFNNEKLKDGIYLDFDSFLNQTPLENYQLRRNDGDVTKAINVNDDDDRIPARKIYVYVETGKAYKNTQAGFLELKKDERGFYVMANRYTLFPEEINTSSPFFLFGAVGGITVAVINFSKVSKELREEKNPIYIDFLNGEFSFTQ